MQLRFALLSLLLAPFAALAVAPQQSQRVVTAPTGRSDILLSVYNEKGHAIFEPMFARPEWVRMRPFAIVLENATSSTIVGLSVHWTYVDRSGVRRTWNVRSDSLFPGGGAPVAPARGKILIVPGAQMSSALVNRGTIAVLPSPATADELTLSSSIMATLDAVIMGDGEVIGPDVNGIVVSIQTREAAVRTLAQAIANAQAAG